MMHSIPSRPWLIAGAAMALAQQAASAMDLSGSVTDLAGKPLAGALVLLGGIPSATGTDSAGIWKMAGGVSSLRQAVDPGKGGPEAGPKISIRDGIWRWDARGFDPGGRMTGSVGVARPVPSFRQVAAGASDSLLVAWNGRVRLRQAIADTNLGAVGALKIDTATSASDIPWNGWGFRFGILRDERDGQVYRTIALGRQLWMAQNLNFLAKGSEWPLRAVDSGAKYGRFYGWSEAMGLSSGFDLGKWGGSDQGRQGVCPTGWHLPAASEWLRLKRTLDSAGPDPMGHLRSNGGWVDRARMPGFGQDSSGFRGLAAGRIEDSLGIGRFVREGSGAWWWSASEATDSLQASVFGSSGISGLAKTTALPVRCLKNELLPDPWAALRSLPRDSGGLNLAVPKGTKTKAVGGTPDSATFGYYLYLPSGARDTATTVRFPLVVSLHGTGFSEGTGLESQLGLGIHYLIANGKWKPDFPFIVASPQNHADNGWNATEVHNYLAYMIAHYPVDPKRVYLVGMSMGAMGVYNYLFSLGSKSYAAAAVPIAGSGGTTSVKNVSCPVWAFHGDKDQNVSPAKDKTLMEAIRAAHPELDIRMTIFSNLEHEWNIWYYPYYPNAIAEETQLDGRTATDPAWAPYDQSIYNWMLRYKLP